MKKLFSLLFALAAFVISSSANITVRFDSESFGYNPWRGKWSHVYLWVWGEYGNLFGTWPGRELYLDEDGWFSYTMPDAYTSVNVILSNGDDQTVDITNITESTCFALNGNTGKNITVSKVDFAPKDRLPIGDLFYKLDTVTKTATVTYGFDKKPYDENITYVGTVNIPAYVMDNNKYYDVTGIGDSAFYYCTDLTSVHIGENVTSIGAGAFDGCKGLTSITIPNNVTSIGDDAFYYCTHLTEPVYNEHVFAYLPTSYSKSTYSIPDGIEYIAGGAFAGGVETYKHLSSVEIPNSVRSIGDRAFYGCTSLTYVKIGNNVLSIGNWAFYGCSALASLNIPNNVRTIGKYAFCECKELASSITIGKSVAKIGDNAFYNTKTKSFTCYAETPPVVGKNTFPDGYAYSSLYVPQNSVEAYKAAKSWKAFKQILPISAYDKPAITVRLDPESCSDWSKVYLYYWGYEEGDKLSGLTWPGIVITPDFSGWYSYTFENDVTKANIIWTDGTNQTVDIKDVSESTCYVLNSPTGTGITVTLADCSEIPTSIDELPTSHTNCSNCTKILRNGQVLILRGDKVYTVTGQEVK